MVAVVPDPRIWDGIASLIETYAGIDVSDTVVVVYGLQSREPAAWVVAGLREFGIEPRLVAMQPLIDEEFNHRLRGVLPDHENVGRNLVILTLERDTMSHFLPLQSVMAEYGHERCKILRLISASEELFVYALKPTPHELSRRNATLLTLLAESDGIRISTAAGSDLTVAFDSRYDWISNRGIWRPGAFTILPAGEIATYPLTISGRLVADGAVNCNVITRMDMRLAEAPLVIDIDDGQAIGFHGGTDEIGELVKLCFARKYGRRVGELGFGTNFGVERFIPANSHINERAPGVHVGFGQHNQEFKVVPYEEEVHLDLITDGATIELSDGTRIDMADPPIEDWDHPNVRDEDITGDCCGFNYGHLRVAPVLS